MPHQEVVDTFRGAVLVAHTAQQPIAGEAEDVTFRVLNLGPGHIVVTGIGWRLSEEIPAAPGQIRTHTIPMWKVLAPGMESDTLPFQFKEDWLRHLTRRVRGDRATLENVSRPRKALVRVQTPEGDGDLVCAVEVSTNPGIPITVTLRLLRK